MWKLSLRIKIDPPPLIQENQNIFPPSDNEAEPVLSEAERLKIHAQAQRVKSSLKKKDSKDATTSSSEEEYEDETDIPFQASRSKYPTD